MMLMLSPVLVTPPVDFPVTLAEAKKQVRAEYHNDDDVYISGLIAAATDHIDGPNGILGRCIVEQTWRQDFYRIGCLRLPLGPVSSIDAISYYDADNAEQTLDDSVYALRRDALGHYVTLASQQSWPTAYKRDDAISVAFVAGQSAEAVPGSIKAAILLMVGHWYENREAVADVKLAELPMGVSALLAPHRVF